MILIVIYTHFHGKIWYLFEFFQQRNCAYAILSGYLLGALHFHNIKIILKKLTKQGPGIVLNVENCVF